MKHSHLLILASLLLLGACGNGTGSHFTEIVYPASRYRIVMADQTSDSLVIASTDSWNLLNDASEWCHYPSEFNYFNNKYSNTWLTINVPLTFDVNTTGKVRSALLKVDGGESTNAAYFSQVPFLGISRPMRIVSNDLTQQQVYPLELAAESTLDSVAFTVYADWTLVPRKGSWLTLEVTQGQAGDHVVNLTVVPNTSAEERKDTLLLRSNGVQDTIFIVQKVPKLQE